MFAQREQGCAGPTFSAGASGILPEFYPPEFTELLIAALLDYPERKALSGGAVVSAELGRKYGIRDIDGKQPRDWIDVVGGGLRYFATN
ncbi:hypothetical protein [Sphingobium sp.]|uniref:hypothetical protein n=1 Tax=Sphingobium sp. TaxID=1912891 RepID=UPI002C474146|nr:hypothetical protein [Sphingobium sp.]HUD94004.1 hypothetical protein [Sphingobium sp.]